MVSRTKFEIDEATLKALFEDAGIQNAQGIAPLGAGEYNAVYEACADGRNYVIKIAPRKEVPVLRYEKDMMDTEVFWYKQMREHTSIRVPEVYYVSGENSRIPTRYFIMEKLPGQQLDHMKLQGEEKEHADNALASMTAQLHRIKNDSFGYVQNGLHDNWYLALCAMVQNVLDDCADAQKKSPRGEKLLKHLHRHREVLERAECCMVNFDIWAPNIICTRQEDGIHYAWIDPERSFWGDRMADFVCFEMLTPLEKKTKSLAAYNAASDVAVSLSKEEHIRYAAALGYLGLIMEVEKYYRYSPRHFGWWRNVLASGMLFKQAFGVLNNE